MPIINSEQLYLVVYPSEYHGIATPSYIKDLYERYLAWFARYVKGEEPAGTGK